MIEKGLMSDTNRAWRTHAQGARDEVRDMRATERNRVDNSMDPWPYYDRNVQTYVREFSRLFPELAHIQDAEHILFLDLFGVAGTEDFGAQSVGVTLDFDGTTNDRRFPAKEAHERRVVPSTSKTQTVIMGNALRPEIASRIADIIQNNVDKKRVIGFWRPIGGVGLMERNPYASARLYALLESVCNASPAKSVLYLDVSDMYAYQAIHTMLLQVSGVSVSIKKDRIGVSVRIEKENTDAILPDWKDVVRNPSVRDALFSINKESPWRWVSSQP